MWVDFVEHPYHFGEFSESSAAFRVIADFTRPISEIMEHIEKALNQWAQAVGATPDAAAKPRYSERLRLLALARLYTAAKTAKHKTKKTKVTLGADAMASEVWENAALPAGWAAESLVSFRMAPTKVRGFAAPLLGTL